MASVGPIRLSALGSRVGPSRFSAGPLQEVMRTPGAHILAQGVPPMSTLPLASMTLTLSDGSTVTLDEAETRTAQRYAPFAWAPLRSWLLEHVAEQHKPPVTEWDVSITAGSMCGIDTVLRLLVDPGDTVLCEEFTFLASKDLLQTLGAELLPLQMDHLGLLPSAVEAACEERLRAGKPPPKLLYTIPVGQNPTGSRLQPERYAQIYALAQKYGLTIVEDDAYFYMQHRSAEPATPLPGLSGLGPTYLSLDTDGRVVRLDTFSKVLAPGFRLAWISGPKGFIAKVDGLQYCSSQWGCSISMAILAKLLHTPGWLLTHVTELQQAMRERCAALLLAADTHLSDLATWQPPQAGMFLWVELKAAREPAALLGAMKRIGVAVMPGESCAAAPPPAGHRHFRLSYVIDEDQYDVGLQKVRQLVTETEPKA